MRLRRDNYVNCSFKKQTFRNLDLFIRLTRRADVSAAAAVVAVVLGVDAGVVAEGRRGPAAAQAAAPARTDLALAAAHATGAAVLSVAVGVHAPRTAPPRARPTVTAGYVRAATDAARRALAVRCEGDVDAAPATGCPHSCTPLPDVPPARRCCAVLSTPRPHRSAGALLRNASHSSTFTRE